MLTTFAAFVSCVLPLSAVGDIETPGRQHGFCPEKENGDASKLASFLDSVSSLANEAKELVQSHDRTLCKEEQLPMDCTDLAKTTRSSGVYTIKPRNRVIHGKLNVLCDMDDDGGGWTVIQRRGNFQSAADYFYRDWESYKIGFGDITKDFWIGNDIIFALTNQKSYSIKFVLTDWEANTTYATYDDFWIDDENHNYQLHVNGYRGTAGDSFSGHDKAFFSTKDRHNDANDKSCAQAYKGAWWYAKCHTSNLNGQYLKGKHESFADGVNWKAFKGYNYSLKDTFMKIRPKNFNAN